MKRKNLFLAVLLLTGINCTTYTATESTKEVASVLSPQGFSFKTIGVLGALIGAGTMVHRIIKNGFHSENQVGIANVNPAHIKSISIKVKEGSKTASLKLNSWNERNTNGKSTFKQNIENKLKIANKKSANFTYEVSLELNNKSSILLTKPLDKSDVITLTKSNPAHKDFAEVLWTNVISHAFVLANDCKKDDGNFKSASELPHASKFDISYQAEITQMDYLLSPHTFVKAAPLALVARITGIPKSSKGLLAYAGAYVTSRLLSKKLASPNRGINFELPKKKKILEDTTEDGIIKAIENFRLKHSAKDEGITLDQWTTETERLKTICQSDAATDTEKREALRALADHAQLEKTFKITPAAILTDKVSGLTLTFAYPTSTVKTGALKAKKIVTLSDFNINFIDRNYWDNAQAAYEATLSGIYNGLCFLSPFGDDDNDNISVSNEELTL